MPELAVTGRKELILKCLISITVIAVAWMRQPMLLLEPRIWAEEGSVFFSYAYSHSWFDNLITTHHGYTTLYNSLATTLATLVPLDYAPHVTSYLAFSVQIFVSLMAIWWDIPLINSPTRKFIIALAIQHLAYARIWATTIGVQYWLCVLTFLILLYPHSDTRRRVRMTQNILLCLNGLTGILSCLMLPAFAYKAFKTRARPVFVHTLILLTCSLLQCYVFIDALLHRHKDLADRFTYPNPINTLTKIVVFEFVVPFFGFLFRSPAMDRVEDRIRSAMAPVFGYGIANCPFSLLEIFAGALIILYIIVLAYKTRMDMETRLTVFSVLLITIISTVFSINMSGGPRYTFAPSVMLMILVTGAIGNAKLPAWMRRAAVVLIACSLTFSLLYYRPSIMNLAYNDEWPKWKDELAHWRQDHSYQLKIWPPPWMLTLHE